MKIEELSDIQSESGIIGTLISHPDFMAHTDYLRPEYFCGKENGCIYWAIQELFNKGIGNIDAYNISCQLQSNKGIMNTLEKYNLPGIQEMLSLYKETSRETLEEYRMLADNVTALAFKRDLAKELERLSVYCLTSKEELGQLNNKVYNNLDDLTQKYIQVENVEPIGRHIDDLWQEIVDGRNPNGLCGIPSKYEVFNKYFTYDEGELVVVQARYKKGKSILLMNEAVHKVRNGVPTVIFDTEMGGRRYLERLIAHITGVPISNVRNGLYSEEEAAKIKKCIEWLKKQPLVHINEPDITDEKIYSICKMLKNKMNLQFVIFDYVKSNEASTSDNYNIIGAKIDFLKNMIASKLKLSVLTACQLNRNDEVADSDKINRYLSVGLKWGFKTREMIARDGLECGNAYAKIYVNRLGEQMLEDDEQEYLDFIFDGSRATIAEAKQHEKNEYF